MKSPVVKRSIVVAGHKTSVSLEAAFWNGMKEISGLRNMTLSELVREIDSKRQQGNLSSAIRLFVLDYFKNGAMVSQKSVSAPPVHVFETPISEARLDLGGLLSSSRLRSETRARSTAESSTDEGLIGAKWHFPWITGSLRGPSPWPSEK